MATLITIGGSGPAGPRGSTGAAGVGTAAPNVTATATVFYEPWANSQDFGFEGTITLPTGDPDYAELDEIQVMAVGPDGDAHEIAKFRDWSGSTIDYRAVMGEQPATDEMWEVQFLVRNESGAPSTSPYTVGPLTVYAAALSAVTGAEVAGARYQDRRQGLHTVIDLTPTISYSQYPLIVTFWVDFGDGVDVWQGWYNFTAGGQSWRIGEANSAAGQEAGDIWVPTLSTRSTWRVKAYPGAVPKQAAIPSGYVTSTFTVTAVGACIPTGVSAAQFINNPATGDPIVYTLVNPGGWKFNFYKAEWTVPTLVADPAYWFSFLTIQKGHSTTGTGTVSGGTTFTKTAGATAFTASDVGKEIHIAGALTTIAGYTSGTVVTLTDALSNGAGQAFDLWHPAADEDGKDADPDLFYRGWRAGGSPQIDALPTQIVTVEIPGVIPVLHVPLPKNVDGTPNLDRDYRCRIYCTSRLGTDPNTTTGEGTYTLQTTCWGGADYFTLTPTDQQEALDLTQVNPITVTGPITGGGGNPITISAFGITDPYIANASIIATKMAANAITAANGAIAANAIVDSKVANVGVAKLIAGTVIFTGDVVFSRGASQPVMVLSNSGLNLFGQADAGTGASGLTSKPYVSIQSTGITVFSGANPSITVTSGAITLWSVNGSSSNPYVLISASGAALVNGSNSVAISSAGLTVADSGGNYLTATSSTITIAKGSSSVTITSSGVTIVNGILSSPVITVVSGGTTINIDSTNFIKVSTSSNSVQVLASSVSIYNGGTGIITLADNGGTGSFGIFRTHSGVTEAGISAGGGGIVFVSNTLGNPVVSLGVSGGNGVITVNGFAGLTTAFTYAKFGGGFGTITVTGGIITSVT